MKQTKYLFILVFLLYLNSTAVFSETILPKKNAIATAHPLATLAGKQIIEQGGNAFDAAVAITAALAVVEPYSSGLGGGGFWMLGENNTHKITFIDGREKAPLKASRNMYLDHNGDYVAKSSVDGALSAGIPGTVAALAKISAQYGQLSLAQALQPAIKYAQEGFKVTEIYRRMANFRLSAIQQSKSANQIFLNKGFLNKGVVPPIDSLIIQSDLANTLKTIASQGKKGFYQGEIAQKLVAGVKKAGGIWSLDDLKQYQVIKRQAINFRYKNLLISSAPPPSSGGIALNTMLNILATYPLQKLSSTEQKHIIIEAMRRAYRDRAQYLGDSDFISIPIEQLTSPYYAAGLSASIHPEHSLASDNLPGYKDISKASKDTTHFVVIDKQGNSVSATMSINYPFGSGFIPPGTGVLLNDEMDDFSVKPGTANVYGLVGAEANAIEAGKRPLSSMSPSIVQVFDKQQQTQGYALVGTPGGSRIITMVLLAILEIQDNHNPQAWVNKPRFHHQYLPDVVSYEADAIDNETVLQLEDMGHVLKALDNSYGNMQALWWNSLNGSVKSAADPRGEGMAITF